jgi:hypothetical protein
VADDRTDPNDPFPDENAMGGVAFRNALNKWLARQDAWRKAHPIVPPGPVKTTTIYDTGTGGTYDLSGFNAGAVAEAEQEATDFAGWLGWPSWFNFNAMVKNILEGGMQADPNQAYQYMWTQLSLDQQKTNSNAYFGLSHQQYLEKLNNLENMYEMFTGSSTVPDSIRNQALRENWSQSELQSALEKDPTVGATSPWVAVGLSYRDVKGQFGSVYGTTPTGVAQLASWWKFKTGAQSVGGGGPAQITYQPPQPLISRPLSSDVETR